MATTSNMPTREEFNRRKEKRLARDIALIGCHNMNDTKWDEFFEIVMEQGLNAVNFRMKVVGNEEIFVEHCLWRITRRWTDSAKGPFENREIEWIEITGVGAKMHVRRSRKTGQASAR